MLYRDSPSSRDFDLRPRRLAPPVPMLSTMQVDDESDHLDALAAAAVTRWEQDTSSYRDARHIALAALPSSLCTLGGDTPWIAKRSIGRRRRPDRAMIGSLVSLALALLFLVAAMLWRLENPRVTHVEGAAPAIQSASTAEVDAVSSASP